MKRIFITLLVALSTVGLSNAQTTQKVSYGDLKGSYNPKEYVRQATDPYNVGWYGVSSFFLPGIGQLLSGETWRGLAFMGGEAVLLSIVKSAADNLESLAITNEKGILTGFTDEAAGRKNMIVLLSALGADLGLSIWSCIDAKRAVKVKNMYYQELLGRKGSVEMSFTPTFSASPTPSGPLSPTAGVAIGLRF